MYASYLPQRLLPDPDTTGSPRRQWNRGILIPPTKIQPYTHRQAKHDSDTDLPLSRRPKVVRAALPQQEFAHAFEKKKDTHELPNNRSLRRHFVPSPRQAPHASIPIFLDSPDPSGGAHLVDEPVVCLCFAMRNRRQIEAKDRGVCFKAATYHFLYTRGMEGPVSRGNGSPFYELSLPGYSLMFILDGKTERGRERRGTDEGRRWNEKCVEWWMEVMKDVFLLAWTSASTLPFYTYLLACIIARAQCSFILCSALVGYLHREVMCCALRLRNDVLCALQPRQTTD
ncbi:hypothetical protein CPLU01_02562 [Colletotrichum plurivorum]|uniref:Uncharacterized protein n=1 Tax=Colletotrichum plurivorum TaxID=2175906 RepID=A0A8H6NMT4_9PEZI|nr:hypothetical protein CPLU01_02562 [Colletotrichum plurivorum]